MNKYVISALSAAVIVLLAVVLMSNTPKHQNSEEGGVALVRVVLALNGMYHIAGISYPDGTSEIVEIPNFNAKKENTLEESTNAITSIVNRMESEGYQLQQVSAGAATTELYVFRKQ